MHFGMAVDGHQSHMHTERERELCASTTNNCIRHGIIPLSRTRSMFMTRTLSITFVHEKCQMMMWIFALICAIILNVNWDVAQWVLILGRIEAIALEVKSQTYMQRTFSHQNSLISISMLCTTFALLNRIFSCTLAPLTLTPSNMQQCVRTINMVESKSPTEAQQHSSMQYIQRYTQNEIENGKLLLFSSYGRR